MTFVIAETPTSTITLAEFFAEPGIRQKNCEKAFR